MSKEHINIKYNNAIQCLRGLAALSVCLFHMRFVFDSQSYAFHLANYLSLGVEVFFIISGYVIMQSLYASGYKWRHYFRFLFRRIVRIEPLYIFVLILFVFVQMLDYVFIRKQSYIFDSTRFFSHFAYLTPWFHLKWYLEVFWTLAIEFQFYLVIALVFFAFISSYSTLNFLVLLALFSTKFITKNDNIFTFYIPYFSIGIALFLFILNKINKIHFLLFSLIIIAYFFLYKHYYVTGTVSIISAIIIYTNTLQNPVLFWLGKISYPLYLCHALVVGIMERLIAWYQFPFIIKFLVLPTITLIFVILFSYALHIFIERTSIELSKKITYT